MENLTSEWSGGNLVFVPTGEALAASVVPAFRVGISNKPVQAKFHNKPATTGSTVEVRAEPSSATATHFAVDSTLDWKANATGGGCRAVQGVCRLAADYTTTGGDLCGVYGQVALTGAAIANSANVFMSALYGLIEDGGTYTAVGHLCSAWLDSHLTKTVTAGSTEFLYISNNGTTTFDSACYIYGGNKIANLFTISTAAGMVNNSGTAHASTVLKELKVTIDGSPGYIKVFAPA
jgi:hypothetical protein